MRIHWSNGGCAPSVVDLTYFPSKVFHDVNPAKPLGLWHRSYLQGSVRSLVAGGFNFLRVLEDGCHGSYQLALGDFDVTCGEENWIL